MSKVARCTPLQLERLHAAAVGKRSRTGETTRGEESATGNACWGQEYIENENARLEREQQFWAKEIVVKIEYKYCPNLTIIDTPGAYASADVCCKM